MLNHLPLIERACSNCGSKFKTIQSSKQKYCSRICDKDTHFLKLSPAKKAKLAEIDDQESTEAFEKIVDESHSLDNLVQERSINVEREADV